MVAVDICVYVNKILYLNYLHLKKVYDYTCTCTC